MSEAYVECLIKAKQSVGAVIARVLLIILTVLLTFMSLLIPLLAFVALATGIGAYLIKLNTDLEFEYLYLDKELVIDKVLAKTKRKRVGTYSFDRMEIFAPINSQHLDNYKNRQVNKKDYSIRETKQPDMRYVMYYEGGEKIILSPSEDMVKVMRNVAPRKVFME